jgi:hypothetical protein
MTSRREFLSNAFGIALVSDTSRPIRADQARSAQGQSDRIPELQRLSTGGNNERFRQDFATSTD